MIRNPLVVILGIGDYDELPNLIGVIKTYFNIIECFNFIRGYSIVYQTRNGNIRHIKKSVESDDQIKERQGFKTYYTDTQIDKFNDFIVKNISTHDKKNLNSMNDNDDSDSDDTSDSDSIDAYKHVHIIFTKFTDKNRCPTC